jgi:hypothetical protein
MAQNFQGIFGVDRNSLQIDHLNLGWGENAYFAYEYSCESLPERLLP